MVRAWFMDNDTSVDQREPHQLDPPQPVTLETLADLGVLYYNVNVDDLSHAETLNNIKKTHGYTYEDMITCSRDKLPNYDEKIKMFFEEHLHDDEEIRLCVDGSGYFDVRNREDKWIRIELVKGDMIILPAGIYHRFTLDTNNYIQAKRYFVGDPVWTPHNRPQEEHPARKSYLDSLNAKQAVTA
ncbi:Ard4p [Mactra antiquata]